MTLLSHSEFPARVSCEVGLEEGRSFRNSHVEVREVLDLRTQSIRLTVEKMTASAPVNSEEMQLPGNPTKDCVAQ
jgi:hypothetical protein